MLGLGFLKKLFKAGDSDEENARFEEITVIEKAKKENSGKGLLYDATIIPAMKKSHQQLVQHFMAIEKYRQRKEYNKMSIEIGAFASLLHDHMLKEQLKVYLYLAKVYEGTEEILVINKIKSDMQPIGKQIFSFIMEFRDIKQWTPEKLADLEKKFKQIQPVLLRRFHLVEKELYPLYLAP